MLAHVFAFKPSLYIAAGFIGAALVGTAMQACGFPSLLFGRRHFDARRVIHLCASLVFLQTLGEFGMGLSGQWQCWQLILLVRQDGLDDTVHQQVGVATNGAGEVRVSLIGQAKVTTVDGRVDGLLHGAQQHGVNLLGIGPVFGGLCNVLKLAGFGLITHGVRQAQRLQVIAQQIFLLGRWAFVHTEQAGMLAALNEIGAADIGCQHSLFNQAVCFSANTRYDFFDAAVVVTNNLRFGGFKIDCTTNST